MGIWFSLLLFVSENGYGNLTDLHQYRLQSRGGKGVINMRTAPRSAGSPALTLVDETSELMVISRLGKIIRIDTKAIRAAGRSTQGVKLFSN